MRPVNDDLDADLGEPIAELRGFSLDYSPDFVERVERSIQRRETAAHVVDLSSRGALLVAMEFLGMIIGATTFDSRAEGGGR